MVESEKFKEHCNRCSGKKNHVVLNEHRFYEEEDDGFWYECLYQIIQCAGCDQIKFRSKSTDSESWDEECSYYSRIKLYPPAIQRELPEWHDEIALPGLYQVMQETYTALQNDSYILATVGIRTIIDLVITDKIGDVGGFQTKLKELVKRKIINEDEKDIINYVIELGNASAHRAYHPDSKVVTPAIDIIEAILERLYVYPNKVSQLKSKSILLKAKIPQRGGDSH